MRSTSSFVFFALALPVLSSPIRRNSGVVPDVSTINTGNAYSGAAGMAQGGSIKGSGDNGLLGLLVGDADVVNINSKNAGIGGNANSGLARPVAIGEGINKGHIGPHKSPNLVNSANSYSGQGGNANGGDVERSGGLLNIDSLNAGAGGSATSGKSGSLVLL